MTNRENLRATIELAKTVTDKTATFGNVHATAEDIISFATDALAKLDAKNAKRSSTPSKTQVENAPIKKAIVEFVASNPSAFAADIAVAVGATPNKVSALCRQLVDEGILVSEEKKNAKKNKVKAFTVVTEVTE